MSICPEKPRRLNEADFERYYPLLESSFPPSERRSRTRQRALLSLEHYRAEGVFDASSAELLLLCCSWRLGDREFIEHLAVSERSRGRGLGAQYLSLRQSRARSDGRALLLEVELPHSDLARRRIAFYERCGFTLNPQLYHQPPMQVNQSALPLKLMTWPLALAEDEFHRVVAELLEKVYSAL